MQYAIAYLNIIGVGFSILEPFIYDDLDSYDEAKQKQNEMVKNGFRQVTIFSFEENELPESITWNFVNNHLCSEMLRF